MVEAAESDDATRERATNPQRMAHGSVAWSGRRWKRQRIFPATYTVLGQSNSVSYSHHSRQVVPPHTPDKHHSRHCRDVMMVRVS